MRHEEGDEEVSVKDCILLASGNRKKDLPFIAKVTALWENPDDGTHIYFSFIAPEMGTKTLDLGFPCPTYAKLFPNVCNSSFQY